MARSGFTRYLQGGNKQLTFNLGCLDKCGKSIPSFLPPDYQQNAHQAGPSFVPFAAVSNSSTLKQSSRLFLRTINRCRITGRLITWQPSIYFPASVGRRFLSNPARRESLCNAAAAVGAQSQTSWKWPSSNSLTRPGSKAAPGAADSSWGLSQRLLALGVVILVLVAAGAVYVVHDLRPVNPAAAKSPEVIQRWFDEQPAAYTLREWRMLKDEGLDRGLLQAEEFYGEAWTRYCIWWSVIALAGAAGMVLIAAGIFFSRQSSPSP